MSAELAKDMPVVTVRDLMQQIKAATERMGVNNSHRSLLLQCASAIAELHGKLRESEHARATITKAANEVLEAEEKAQRRVELVTL
jgi:hypothetical protein